jgi:hypothetical protein
MTTLAYGTLTLIMIYEIDSWIIRTIGLLEAYIVMIGRNNILTFKNLIIVLSTPSFGQLMFVF